MSFLLRVVKLTPLVNSLLALASSEEELPSTTFPEPPLRSWVYSPAMLPAKVLRKLLRSKSSARALRNRSSLRF